MKTIGLIGGMSWESSSVYYRLINEGVRLRLGGSHSADCLMVSPDFAEIEALQHAGQWQQLESRLVRLAQGLEAGGADFLVLCTNTMHRFAPQIIANTRIDFLHIADPTAQEIKQAGLQKVGLLGTCFTMEQDFYKGRLEREHGLQVLIPEVADREQIHRIIYEELVRGVVKEASRRLYRNVIARLVSAGAQAIILGCTEIMLLVGAQDSPVPLFDTTTLHAQAAVAKALERLPKSVKQFSDKRRGETKD